MKIKDPWKCDVCERPKGEGNHWFNFMANATVTAALGSDVVSFTTNALFSKWNDVVADMPGVRHICSQACASKALSQWMESA